MIVSHTQSQDIARSLSTRKRIDFLDGLRAIAVIAVIAFHVHLDGGGLPEKIIRRALQAGWMGVDLFFVLSGFLITGILLRSNGTLGALAEFWNRRSARILPAYFAYLAFAFLFIPYFSLRHGAEIDQNQFAPAALFLINFEILIYGRSAIPEGLVHLWSLCVEQHFYLLWPLAVTRFSRKRLIAFCLAIIAITPVIRTLYVMAGGETTYFQTFCRIDSMIAGAFVAIVLHGLDFASSSIRTIRSISASLLVVSGVTLIVFWCVPGSSHRSPLFATVGYSICALTFASLICWLIASPMRLATLIKQLLSKSILIPIAKYSYSIYLFHYPISFWMADFAKQISAPWVVQWLAAFAATFVLSFTLAAVSWSMIESPAAAMLRRRSHA